MQSNHAQTTKLTTTKMKIVCYFITELNSQQLRVYTQKKMHPLDYLNY